MQPEQHVDGDIAGNQLIIVVRLRLLGVVGQHLRLHIAADVGPRPEPVQQPESRNRERHIEPNPERRRRQHHGPNSRREIMYPRRRGHSADTVGDQYHVLDRDAVLARYEFHEGIEVPDMVVVVLGITARAGRMPVATQVPGESPAIFKTQLLDLLLDSPRVLMAPVQEYQRLVAGSLGRPGAEE